MIKTLNKAAHCPLCQSPRLSDAFEVQYWREHTLTYNDCAACGAVFANPMPSDAVITQGNEALVRRYQQHRSLEQEFREARQAYLRGRMLARSLTSWKKHGRVLELGCYHGFFSYGIKNHSHWEVEGLEISSELSRFVQEVLGMTCHCGTLESLSLPQDRYDFIVCHDLIEHINQPTRFLQQLSRILAPGGRIQIVTPNAHQDLAFTRRAWRAGIRMPMLLNHIMYFRPRTLKHALSAAGLKIRNLYCYDVRHVLKDFDVLGRGTPVPSRLEQQEIPSIADALTFEARKTLSLWTPEKLTELRTHPKVSLSYGLLNVRVPELTTMHVPASWELGHEIYALAEKPLRI